MLLAGQFTTTTFQTYTPWKLWQQFRPLVKDIPGRLDETLMAMHRYPQGLDMTQVAADQPFEQWALVQIQQEDKMPDGIHTWWMEGGDYAVFEQSGTVENFRASMHWLIAEGLPPQQLALDARPYFEIMDHRYKGPADPDSLETVYVPVKSWKESP